MALVKLAPSHWSLRALDCHEFRRLELPSQISGRMCSGQTRRRAAEAAEMPTFKYVGKKMSRRSNVRVCGFSFTGALGIPHLVRTKGTKFDHVKEFVPTPYKLPMTRRITSVACGYGFTLLASNNLSTPKVWGSGVNTDSQLGFQPRNETLESGLSYLIAPARIELPLKRPRDTRVVQVACGRAHSLILTDKEGVFSLGNNAHGQCGRPVIEKEDYSSNRIINRIKGIHGRVTQVSCGHDHSLFLTEEGAVYSCGWGADGQTGLDHYDSCSLPTKLEGDIAGEKITHVASFSDCCLAISEKGDLFGWGNSEYSQLNLVTDETQVCTPRHLDFRDIGRVVSAAVGGSICALVNEALLQRIHELLLGNAGLTPNWGLDWLDMLLESTEGGRQLVTLRYEGDLFTWGYGILGKGPKLGQSKYPQHIPSNLLGRSEVNPDVRVSKVTCGLHHFAAVTDRGDLYSWGTNTGGCLGLGTMGNQYFPLRAHVSGEVLDVACGVDHTVILSKSMG